MTQTEQEEFQVKELEKSAYKNMIANVQTTKQFLIKCMAEHQVIINDVVSSHNKVISALEKYATHNTKTFIEAKLKIAKYKVKHYFKMKRQLKLKEFSEKNFEELVLISLRLCSKLIRLKAK